MKFDIEFWKSSTKKCFDETAKELIEKGFTKLEAKELLEGLYYAVADEYGG